jgi:hypothetical protein
MSSKSKEKIRSMLSDPRVAPKIAAKLKERSQTRRALSDESGLLEPQVAFLRDKSHRKAACCSRRAGKSFSLARQLVEWANEHPGCIVPYITLTRESAKTIIWPAIREVCEGAGIAIEMKRNSGDVYFPHNGSRIILRGCQDEQEIEKLRGPKYPGVVIDEAQSLPPHITEMIDEILEPATMDYNGSILITGTPGPLLFGPFYEIVNGFVDGWSVHHWTWRDNHHLDNPELTRFQWIERLKQTRGWTEDTPKFQREYGGKWVRDESNLVYRFRDFNLVTSMDVDIADDWVHVLGIDLGFNDPSAFVVLRYSPSQGRIHIVESYQEAGLLASDVAVHIMKLAERYDFESIVCDSGGYGKAIVESLRREHGIPVSAADKSAKTTAIARFNEHLSSGRMFIDRHANSILLHQMAQLQWKVKSLELGNPKEDRGTPNHLCDAAVYAHRACHVAHDEWEAEAAKEGTPAWFAAQEEAEEAAEEARVRRERERPWWMDEVSEEDLDGWL